MTPSPMEQVVFTSSSGKSLTVMNGATSPVLSNGVVTWDTIARPKRKALTRYTGRTPLNQDIPVIFDGYHKLENQEARIAKLHKMSTEPHTITLSGHALHTELPWVFIGIDWDDQETIWIRGNEGPVRVRQVAVVHLMEFVDEKLITSPTQLREVIALKNPIKNYKTLKGMTLKQIAQAVYGNPDDWRVIVDANEAFLLGVDNPRYFVKEGITLFIPMQSGPEEPFKVP